jgi:hypothetical protein
MPSDQRPICSRCAIFDSYGREEEGSGYHGFVLQIFPYQKFALDMDDAIFANLYYKAGEMIKQIKW